MKRGKGVRRPASKRCHRLVLLLNDEEEAALNYFLKKYRRAGDSKASLIRQLLLGQLIRRCEDDSEMLFSEEEMR